LSKHKTLLQLFWSNFGLVTFSLKLAYSSLILFLNGFVSQAKVLRISPETIN